ncbi:peptidase MA family metallohydrolase [Terriglobus roseus]|uniref:Flp pilus assembly protein TadD, contains TPR repeats n=1 Tax=Terriglobus roseus TaxID=392734 RepID=A0A1H4LLC0_9BACT|nr:tetratricopeptide repeat protein [Terriglobus roseus]SEB71346.1 Flp pilus assembly protein TadD, contains TPR repeats [Terriglobus roseus]
MMRVLAIATVLCACVSAHAVLPATCWQMQKHGQQKQADACFTQLTLSRDAYERAEGFWGVEDWQNANAAFREATAPAASPAQYKVRWGMLLHERFNNAEASDLFREALAKDPNNAAAYLGLATVQAQDYSGDANESIAKALAIDPKLAAAHELAATIALDNDNRELAATEADKALAIDNEAVDAMAVRASLELIADKPADAWFSKITAINPHDGEAYTRVGQHLELHYRFSDAAVYYRKATEVQPSLWAAHSLLGVELMRLGQEDEPLKQLELAYENGYRNPATVNSLRLLDTYKNFTTTRDATTIVRLDKKENDLLEPYIQAELHTILETYSKKYKMTLPAPVQVEVYPNHEDFAVRTMGMPGLGALGVTFGEVVAMDSPSGRKPGDFNWGATLWHEMSHVFIITATNQRVPRWFTEGLAVHEEGQRSPEWSDRVTPDVLLAIRAKKLLPILKLDRGFVFQEYPQQVLVSYFQGGSICDYIAAKWGEGKLLEMVHSYAAGKTTAEVIQTNLAMSHEEFDKQFLASVDGKYGAEAAHFDEWRAKLKALATAAQAKQMDVIVQQAPAVIALYPEYIGDANAYELLADAQHDKGDAKAEAAVLLQYEHQGGQQPELLKRLAALQEAAGDKAEAIATLTRVLYIYPVKDTELHQHLGTLLMAQKQFGGAIREYSAVVATNPLDKAGAEYNLAAAYMAAGQRDKAQETVLIALEAAPDYRPAQKLLLELQGH